MYSAKAKKERRRPVVKYRDMKKDLTSKIKVTETIRHQAISDSDSDGSDADIDEDNRDPVDSVVEDEVCEVDDNEDLTSRFLRDMLATDRPQGPSYRAAVCEQLH